MVTRLRQQTRGLCAVAACFSRGVWPEKMRNGAWYFSGAHHGKTRRSWAAPTRWNGLIMRGVHERKQKKCRSENCEKILPATQWGFLRDPPTALLKMPHPVCRRLCFGPGPRMGPRQRRPTHGLHARSRCLCGPLQLLLLDMQTTPFRTALVARVLP